MEIQAEKSVRHQREGGNSGYIRVGPGIGAIGAETTYILLLL